MQTMNTGRLSPQKASIQPGTLVWSPRPMLSATTSGSTPMLTASRARTKNHCRVSPLNSTRWMTKATVQKNRSPPRPPTRTVGTSSTTLDRATTRFVTSSPRSNLASTTSPNTPKEAPLLTPTQVTTATQKSSASTWIMNPLIRNTRIKNSLPPKALIQPGMPVSLRNRMPSVTTSGSMKTVTVFKTRANQLSMTSPWCSMTAKETSWNAPSPMPMVATCSTISTKVTTKLVSN